MSGAGTWGGWPWPRGSAPAWQDLLGSHVPSYISPFGNEAITRHKGGEARVLAITGASQARSNFSAVSAQCSNPFVNVGVLVALR